jgi:hypothetical protein
MKRVTVELPAPVAAIYKAVEDLYRLYPHDEYGRKFTPDGHLVGSIGEVIAAKELGLTLLKSSTKGHDAEDKTGRPVQIKMTATKRVGIYHDCDRLVVLKIVSSEKAEIVYDGDGAPAWEAARPARQNGQRTISLAKLRALAKAPE